MSLAPDVQLARVAVLLAADRPAPEPTEAEVRQVAEHLGATAQAHEAGAETAEAGR